MLNFSVMYLINISTTKCYLELPRYYGKKIHERKIFEWLHSVNSAFWTEQESEESRIHFTKFRLNYIDSRLSSPQGSTITLKDHRSNTSLPTLHFLNSNFNSFKHGLSHLLKKYWRANISDTTRRSLACYLNLLNAHTCKKGKSQSVCVNYNNNQIVHTS